MELKILFISISRQFKITPNAHSEFTKSLNSKIISRLKMFVVIKRVCYFGRV